MSQQTGKRNEMVIDFVGKMECEVENMCRICGDCATNMIRIFEEEGLKQHLYEKLHRHFPEIEISEGNGFPSQVCNNCSSALSSWDDLYNTCMLVDKKLKAFLDNLERKQSCDVEKYIISVDMEPDNSPKVDEPEYSLIESEDIASDIVVESDSVFSYLDCSYENSVVSDCEERTEQDVCENKEDSIKEYVVDEDHINEFDGCVGFETDEMGVPKIDIEDETSPLLFQPALEYKKDSSHSELPFSEIDFSTALLDIDCSRQRMSCAASKSIANLDADQKKFEDAETLPERRRAEDAEIPDVPLNVELDDLLSSNILCHGKNLLDEDASLSGIDELLRKNDSIIKSGFLTDITHGIERSSEDAKNDIHRTTERFCIKTDHQSSEQLAPQLLSEESDVSIQVNLEKVFICNFCEMCFFGESDLREHISENHVVGRKSEIFVCYYCKIEFYTKTELLHHMKKEHIELSETIKVECRKRNRSLSSTTAPENGQTSEKKCYVCNICGKRFKQQSRLVSHRRSELNVRKYSCQTCGKCFIQSSHLIVHKKVHSGERNFKCYICGKTFVARSHLAPHIRRHMGEKNYSCDVCGKKFYEKYLLNVHKSVHSDYKPYQCNLCDNTFKTLAALKQHEKTHKNWFINDTFQLDVQHNLKVKLKKQDKC